ncbi:hypothetical protein ACFX13_009594 [Malus domestica]
MKNLITLTGMASELAVFTWNNTATKAGFITAQSRKSSQETTGYVFLRCVITGNGRTSYAYLGRPWGPFGRVVFAYIFMDGCIRHVGWNNWGKTENERTACFYEYRYNI